MGRELFTPIGVQIIKKEYDKGMSIKQLADRWGCSVGTIHALLTGQTYGGLGKTKLRPPKGANRKAML